MCIFILVFFLGVGVGGDCLVSLCSSPFVIDGINARAVDVLSRVKDKLNGKDFMKVQKTPVFIVEFIYYASYRSRSELERLCGGLYFAFTTFLLSLYRTSALMLNHK